MPKVPGAAKRTNPETLGTDSGVPVRSTSTAAPKAEACWAISRLQSVAPRTSCFRILTLGTPSCRKTFRPRRIVESAYLQRFGNFLVLQRHLFSP